MQNTLACLTNLQILCPIILYDRSITFQAMTIWIRVSVVAMIFIKKLFLVDQGVPGGSDIPIP